MIDADQLDHMIDMVGNVGNVGDGDRVFPEILFPRS